MHVGTCLVLFLSASVDRDIALDLSVLFPLRLDLFLVLLQLVTLRDCFQGKTLVLLMDLSLDGLDCY